MIGGSPGSNVRFHNDKATIGTANQFQRLIGDATQFRSVIITTAAANTGVASICQFGVTGTANVGFPLPLPLTGGDGQSINLYDFFVTSTIAGDVIHWAGLH